MSLAPPRARPAARRAAVRPRSTSSPRTRELTLARSAGAPRPATGCAPPGAPHPLLFFRFSPRPIGYRQVLVADAGSHRFWEPGTASGTRKPCAFSSLRHGSRVSAQARAHVMRSRSRTCRTFHLTLGTWELSLFPLYLQWVERFPTRFPAALALGTWEPAGRLGSSPDRLNGSGNKLGAEYGDLQRAGAGARRKFQARDRVQAVGLVLDPGRIQLQLTRRAGIGGFLPFLWAAAGHVGTAMLEGSGQGTANAALSAQRRELGRLAAVRLVGSALGEIELRGRHDRPDRTQGPGTPPNAAAPASGMLPLHAGGIWIENRAQGPVSSGLQTDGIFWTVSKNAQTLARRRGPGGAALIHAAAAARSAPHREVGKRAGVNCFPAVARPHEAGGKPKLRREFAGVNANSGPAA